MAVKLDSKPLDQLVIRTADVYRDWPGIWPIWQRVVSEGETHPYPVDCNERDARGWWLGPSGAVVYVAELHGVVTAAVMTKPMRYGNGAHVANFDIIVNPEVQGRGVGRALLSYVIEESRKAGYKAMEAYAVVETNERSVRLLYGLGFNSLAVTPKSFRHPRYGLVGTHYMYLPLT